MFCLISCLLCVFKCCVSCKDKMSNAEVTPSAVAVESGTDRERLWVENEALAKQLRALTESHERVIYGLISCQGLIAQFSKPAVRAAFRNGDLGTFNSVEDILASIIKFREIMLPTPLTMGARAEAPEGCSAIAFVIKLLSKDVSEPKDAEGNYFPCRQSFADWRKFFHALASSNYWADLQSEGALGQLYATSGVASQLHSSGGVAVSTLPSLLATLSNAPCYTNVRSEPAYHAPRALCDVAAPSSRYCPQW